MKRRNDLRPEVQSAVDDLLNGVTTDSLSEWLQREYIRLMRREAAYKGQNESKLEKKSNETNGSSSNQDRTAE